MYKYFQIIVSPPAVCFIVSSAFALPRSLFSFASFCCSSVTILFLTLQPQGLVPTRLTCPSLLLEFAQTHVHSVSDAIQPSHHLLPPSPLALNFSQNQGLFQWAGSLHQVAKALEFQLRTQNQIIHSGSDGWALWFPN